MFGEDHAHFLSVASRIAAVTLENILALDELRSENKRLKARFDPANKLYRREPTDPRRSKSSSAVFRRVTPRCSFAGRAARGKELVARAIHAHSKQADRPFVAINCAAIPEALLESELFGHEKGAFTGAFGMKAGKLEAAEDGTLFLDEIGELAPLMQAKLLRVLQQREFESGSGELDPCPSERESACSHQQEPSNRQLRAVSFCPDLYFIASTLSPLSFRHCVSIEKTSPTLALYFATKYAERSNRPFKGISPEARALLMGYGWPGNVRELESAIEHAIVLGLTGEILPEDLPGAILGDQLASLAGARYHDVLTHARGNLSCARSGRRREAIRKRRGCLASIRSISTGLCAI